MVLNKNIDVGLKVKVSKYVDPLILRLNPNVIFNLNRIIDLKNKNLIQESLHVRLLKNDQWHKENARCADTDTTVADTCNTHSLTHTRNP